MAQSGLVRPTFHNGMELPVHIVPEMQCLKRKKKLMLSGRQEHHAGKLIYQEMLGTAEMSCRALPLQQEHAAPATVQVQHAPRNTCLKIGAGEGFDGAGAEGTH